MTWLDDKDPDDSRWNEWMEKADTIVNVFILAFCIGFILYIAWQVGRAR